MKLFDWKRREDPDMEKYGKVILKPTTVVPAPGARRRKNRVGRGVAAGQGNSAGKGMKGQKQRSGGGKGPLFEGGQTPLHKITSKKRTRGRYQGMAAC